MRVIRKLERLAFVKVLSILLLVLALGSFVVPLFFKSGDSALVALLPLLGILFLGVGAAMIVAEKICSKKL